MVALAETQSTLGQHKGKFAVGGLLFLAGACGLYGFFNSGQQNPPITEIAPIIQPTDDFVSGVGGGIEDDVMPQSGIGCWDAYGKDYYNIGAVTPYTHSECLGNSLWQVPNDGDTILFQARQLPPPVDQ